MNGRPAMKKGNYETPEMEVIVFENRDVIVTSEDPDEYNSEKEI